MQRVSGQLLRRLLQNLRNFSEVAPEVHPAVHTALLCLTSGDSRHCEEVGVGAPMSVTSKVPRLSGHYSRDWSEYVNVIGVISVKTF